MKRVDDFRLKFGKQELVPIMVGGMGVDISTAELALETARLGGIGHISDAMVTDVSDRRFDTSFVKDKTKFYKYNIDNADKSGVKFDLGHVAEATRLHVGRTMEAKQGAFVTSSRAPLEARGIASGSDATFRIRVPHADHVGRYRVSFRMDDHIIPHADRRDEP